MMPHNDNDKNSKSNFSTFPSLHSIERLELLLSYKFNSKNLLVNALIHPSAKITSSVFDRYCSQTLCIHRPINSSNKSIATKNEQKNDANAQKNNVDAQKTQKNNANTAVSVASEDQDGKTYINQQRLEFLGDAVLKLAISRYIYSLFPDLDEGNLSRIYAKLSCGAALTQCAQSLSVGDYIIANSKEDLRNHSSALENTMEAIIGAIYLDSSFDTVQDFIIRIWNPFFADENIDNLIKRDSKTLLQEITQKIFKSLPLYSLIKEEKLHDSHDSIFHIKVQIANKNAVGIGKSKKIAETNAAKELIKILNIDL